MWVGKIHLHNNRDNFRKVKMEQLNNLKIRILHTSDWHLGKKLHDFDRSLEYERFRENLINIIEDKKPHLMLVSGDVFDTINPPLDAEKFLGMTLNEIRTRYPELHIVITCGNHDSARKIDSVSVYMECCERLKIVGELPVVCSDCSRDRVDVDYKKLIYPVYTMDGSLQAVVVAMPYLNNNIVWNLDVARNGMRDDFSYESAVSGIYQGCLDYIKHNEELNKVDVPLIAMGHFFAKDTKLKGDERDKAFDVVGGEQSLGTSVFDGFDYVALGHIHLRQNITDDRRVRYCGSPLPVNFGECEYRHGVDIVDIKQADEPDSGNRYEISVNSQIFERTVDFIRIPSGSGYAGENAVLEALDKLSLMEKKLPAALLPFCSIFAEYDPDNTDFRDKGVYRNLIESKIGELSGRVFRFCDFKFTVRAADKGSGEKYEDDVQSLDDITSPVELASRMYREVYDGKEMPEEIKNLLVDVIREIEKSEDNL